MEVWRYFFLTVALLDQLYDLDRRQAGNSEPQEDLERQLNGPGRSCRNRLGAFPKQFGPEMGERFCDILWEVAIRRSGAWDTRRGWASRCLLYDRRASSEIRGKSCRSHRRAWIFPP